MWLGGTGSNFGITHNLVGKGVELVFDRCLSPAVMYEIVMKKNLPAANRLHFIVHDLSTKHG